MYTVGYRSGDFFYPLSTHGVFSEAMDSFRGHHLLCGWPREMLEIRFDGVRVDNKVDWRENGF